MDKYDFISPIDFRYYGNNSYLFEKLNPFLSENAFVKYQLRVEEALGVLLAKKGAAPKEFAKQIKIAVKKVKPSDVYEEEKKTKHYTKALVNSIKKYLRKDLQRFVHLGATSFDISDTANALRFKEVTEKVVLQELKDLEKTLIQISLREKKTLQIGRTHGQHGVPITFGFALSSYVARLGSSIKRIERAENDLRGKLSGAVGAYNAPSLLSRDAIEFEKEVLKELGLKPGSHSTQIVEPEYLTELIYSILSCYGVLANLADDMRHLQRSEINEVAEEFDSKQVGSSTMPHKRNPWNFENIKSMWKTFTPRMITVFMDQISEHQRDLSNSASQRFLPEIFFAITESTYRMNGLMKKLIVDKESMKKNFEMNKEMITAEPLYILLSLYGHEDAHEAVKQLTLKAQKLGQPLRELAFKDKELNPYLKKFTKKQLEIIQNPEKYIGESVKKTEQVCRQWKKELKI